MSFAQRSFPYDLSGFGATKVSTEEWREIVQGAPEHDPSKHELRFKGIGQHMFALAITCTYDQIPFPYTKGITVLGWRTMRDLREDGYVMRGRVSVNSVTRSAFTTSHLFDVEGIGLVDVACFHVCSPRAPKPMDRIARRSSIDTMAALRMYKAGLVCHVSNIWPGPDSGATWNPSLRRWAWWTDKAGKPASAQWESVRARVSVRA